MLTRKWTFKSFKNMLRKLLASESSTTQKAQNKLGYLIKIVIHQIVKQAKRFPAIYNYSYRFDL